VIFSSTVVGALEVNCYLLACEETREGIIIDPGDNVETILQLIKDNNVNIVEIVATHGHFDHIGRVTSLKEATGAPFAIHKADMFMVEGLVDIAAFLGLETDPPPQVDRFIDESDTITFGKETLNIRYVPGHAPGNIALIWPGHAIIGDTVFSGSIGRTDLEGADPETLMESIRTQILTLPEDTILHPGHGPDTTVDREKRANPFLAVG
jgi:hydroxyacylglutathione hydrolase